MLDATAIDLHYGAAQGLCVRSRLRPSLEK